MSLLRLKYGGLIFGNGCSFCDVYLIDIDNERIELSDIHGMVIGTIDHNTIYEDIEMIEYDSSGHLDGNIKTLFDKNKKGLLSD